MKTILTKEGMSKLRDELNYLLNVEQGRAIADLVEARESGALDENTQYIIAKDEYEKLLSKIEKLRIKLSEAVIVDYNNIKTDKVAILNSVKVINVNDEKEISFTIVPEDEIDSKNGKISSLSPIGMGLIGKKVGDICDIKIPNGSLKFKILEIN